MTKAATKKPQTLKTAKPAGKVTKPKAVKAGYYRAIDLMMASVAYAQKGMPNRAAKALADAVQDPQIDEAMEFLNNQQTQEMDQATDLDQDVVFDDQAQMSKTLARLIRGAQTADAVQAADEDDEQDDEEEDEEDDEQDSEESSTTETAGEDEQDDEDGLDISMDQDDEDGDAQEQQVQASVQSRLARAARNRARRA